MHEHQVHFPIFAECHAFPFQPRAARFMTWVLHGVLGILRNEGACTLNILKNWDILVPIRAVPLSHLQWHSYPREVSFINSGDVGVLTKTL